MRGAFLIRSRRNLFIYYYLLFCHAIFFVLCCRTVDCVVENNDFSMCAVTIAYLLLVESRCLGSSEGPRLFSTHQKSNQLFGALLFIVFSVSFSFLFSLESSHVWLSAVSVMFPFTLFIYISVLIFFWGGGEKINKNISRSRSTREE